MDLPGELRNRIYSLVIPKEKDADYLIALNGPRHIAQTVLKSSIFKLNKQIRFESMSYKFADQNFTFSDVKIMTNFLRWVGKPGRALLTRMTLIGLLCDGLEGYDVEIPEIDASLPFMLQATGLKKFQLIVRADYNEITRKPNLFVHPDKKWNCFLRLRETVESIGAEFHWEFYSNSNDGNGSLIPIRLHRHVLVDVDLSRDMNLGYEILDGTEVVGVPVARPPGYPIRIMD